jgi:DNA end-binding protein Ku
MKAFLTGTIRFGLITIPIKVYTATQDRAPKFTEIHATCGTRLNHIKRCTHCNVDVPWAEMGKGHEVEGKMIAFTKDELKALDGEGEGGDVEIMQFVEPGEVEPVMYEKAYWLGPGGDKRKKGDAAPSYALLMSTLEDTGLSALVTIKMRSRTRLGVVSPMPAGNAKPNVLGLTLLRYPDEVVDAAEIAPAPSKASDKERALARQLVEGLVAPFDPSKTVDEHRARVMAFVEARAADASAAAPAPTAPAPAVMDLEALLAASIGASGKAGVKDTTDTTATAPKAAHKKQGAA